MRNHLLQTLLLLTILQQPPPKQPDILKDLIAELVNETGLGIPVADAAAMAKVILDKLKRTEVLIMPAGADRTKSANVGNDKPDLTVAATAYQVPFGEKFGINLLMEVETSASTTVGKFKFNGMPWVSMPFVGVADKVREVSGITADNYVPSKGPIYIQKATYRKPPVTGFRVPKPFTIRLGTVFGAMNYANVDGGLIIFDKYLATKEIDRETGKPIFFTFSKDKVTVKIVMVPEASKVIARLPLLTLDEIASYWKDRKYITKIVPPDQLLPEDKKVYPNGFVIVSSTEVLNPYAADFLSLALSIQWGRPK